MVTIRRLISRFIASHRGNVAIIFGLSAFLLVCFIGVAVDTTMVQSTKQRVQGALDSAVLEAAIINTTDANVIKTQAAAAFKSNLIGQNTDAKITSLVYDQDARTVTATAAGTYNPFFVQLLGYSKMDYTVNAESIRAADGTLEVALVLDNTYSMSVPLDGSQTKLQVLKTAANNLVSTLMTPANKNYVKMAVVPYADYINIGTTWNRTDPTNTPWLNVADDYANTVVTPAKCTDITTSTTCTGGTKGTCYQTKDGVSVPYTCWLVAQTCTTVNLPLPYKQSCTAEKTTVTQYKWWGCLYSQMVTVSGKTSLAMPDPTGKYKGFVEQSSRCVTAITPLTDTNTAVTSAINSMATSTGSYALETYTPSGLIWGVNVLSPVAPYTQGVAYDPNNKTPRKAIILMTDGKNTAYSNTSGGVAVANSTQLAVTYNEQAAICDYAKSKKIEIYTIGFGVDDATALAALKSCATDADHYFDAKSSDALVAAFKTIGGKLSRVRLTK